MVPFISNEFKACYRRRILPKLELLMHIYISVFIHVYSAREKASLGEVFLSIKVMLRYKYCAIIEDIMLSGKTK